MRLREASRDQSEGGVWRVDSRVNLGSNSGQFWSILRKPHRIVRKSLHLAVGRALNLKYTKYGVLGWSWLGTG